MINRAVLMLSYKQPAVDWINEAESYNSPEVTLSSVNEEKTVYLVAHEITDTPKELEAWIKLNCEVLFENELYGWYVDETLWPKKRNWTLFKKWFSYECHSVVEDTVGAPILDLGA
ncbi:hypothetical protein BEI46_18360 [Aliivibrio fischeri]|uniref:hypothetical protein n=1 Tax=Aliivibrio fischeri TaxID=668 RepID=UPI00084C2C1C|nr:hypothetical protein [Aliivibrio fischeri]OED52743.1 hypothetical protein BEI46_18360 [Aliivibrio fischeri]